MNEPPKPPPVVDSTESSELIRNALLGLSGTAHLLLGVVLILAAAVLDARDPESIRLVGNLFIVVGAGQKAASALWVLYRFHRGL